MRDENIRATNLNLYNESKQLILRLIIIYNNLNHLYVWLYD